MSLDTAPILLRKRNVAFKLETTTGALIALAAADAVTPIFTDGDEGVIAGDIEVIDREGQGSISPIPEQFGAEGAAAKFKHELYNSGSGTLPKWTDLLLGCGMSNASGVFTPITGATHTLTIGHFLTGRALYCVGSMGTWTLTATRAKPAMMAYDFTGVWSRPKGDVITTPTYDSIVAPKSAATLTIGGSSYFIPEVVVEFGNEVVRRENLTAVNADGDLVGYHAAYIVDRKTRVRMSPESVPLTTHDWYEARRSGTTAALNLVIGSGTNGTVTVAAPKMQIVASPAIESRNKMMADKLEFMPLRNTDAGDDDISVTLT